MRKLLISIFFVFLTGNLTSMDSFHSAYAQRKPIPPYAKWGQLAMERTHEKYPNAQIIDYLHIGRETGPKFSTEKFKLWLKDKNNKEFGVFINIQFHNETQKVIKVTFKETTH